MTPFDFGRELPTVREAYSKSEGFAWNRRMEDLADMRVLPVALARDSQPIDESNFDAAQRILDDAGAVYEVHRFGHWGVGWYEAILVAPDAASLAAAGEIVRALESYPLLDEGDASYREFKDQIRAWRDWGARDYVDDLPLEHDRSREVVRDYLESISPHDAPGMRHVEQHSDGPHFSYRALDRGETAQLLFDARRWKREGWE